MMTRVSFAKVDVNTLSALTGQAKKERYSCRKKNESKDLKTAGLNLMSEFEAAS